jgi:hypothetical protein
VPTDRYLTRRELVEFLNSHGYPISVSTLARLSMPSRGEGPKPEGRWGAGICTGLIGYSPGRAIASAQLNRRCRAVSDEDRNERPQQPRQRCWGWIW